MKKWGFYGRRKELQEMDMSQYRTGFQSYLVLGRRKVGKTELLKKGLEGRPGSRPVFFTMPQEKHTTAQDAVNRFEKDISAAGYGLPPYGLHDDSPKIRFTTLIEWLIEKNVNTVIDEFHHVDRLGLVSPVHAAVSHLRGDLLSRPRPQRGKLFFCGSHEQMMMDMFMPREPLHNSVSRYHIRPKQWNLREIMEMASDQGLLRNPYRFLTLYSAFGGMPGAWRAFIEDGDHAKLERKDPYSTGSRAGLLAGHQEWTGELIRGEAMLLHKDSDSKWDSQNFVYLTDQDRKMFSYICGYAKGRTVRQLAGKFGIAIDDFSKETVRLCSRLELIDAFPHYFGKREHPDTSWRVSDPVACFQKKILDRLADAGDSMDEKPRPLAIRMVEELDGTSLERMAADWMRCFPQTWSARHGVTVPYDLPDMDAIGVSETAEDEFSMMLASCKRNPGSHDITGFRQSCDRFLKAALASETRLLKERWKEYDALEDYDKAPEVEPRDTVGELKRMSAFPRRHILVSPLFMPDDRARLSEQGFECIDMHDMARSLGFEPEARYVPHPPQDDGFSP